jgi:hypothetical protein
LSKLISDIAREPIPPKTAESRLTYLSTALHGWAGQPKPDIRDGIIERHRRILEWRIRGIQNHLAAEDGRVRVVGRDLRQCLAVQHANLGALDSVPVLDNKPELTREADRLDWIISEIERFARALEVWPDLWNGARSIAALEE